MDRTVNIAVTGSTYRGNKGAAAMLQSSVAQLHRKYGDRLKVFLLSAWPQADRERCPWDCVEVVSARKKTMALKVLPLAVLYRLFRRCGPIRRLLLKNPVLNAYSRTDLVLDEPGISFVDTRSAALNAYAFISLAVPLLMGVPVVKYSQALGTFRKASNRIPAKIILPRIRLILARGELTRQYLAEIGVTKNVRVCADGALSMEEDPAAAAEVEEACRQDPFLSGDRIVCLFPSAVVSAKCAGRNIDYTGVLAGFIRNVNAQGYGVLLIANTAIPDGSGTKNNDLPVCREIYDRCADKSSVRFFDREMTPEQILAWVGRCRFVVASRFHGMIFALKQKKPVMLIGWSHKYQEVLDQFGLGSYTADFSSLTEQSMAEQFTRLTGEEQEILRKIDENYSRVMESSRQNIALAAEILEEVMKNEQ